MLTSDRSIVLGKNLGYPTICQTQSSGLLGPDQWKPDTPSRTRLSGIFASVASDAHCGAFRQSRPAFENDYSIMYATPKLHPIIVDASHKEASQDGRKGTSTPAESSRLGRASSLGERHVFRSAARDGQPCKKSKAADPRGKGVGPLGPRYNVANATRGCYTPKCEERLRTWAFHRLAPMKMEVHDGCGTERS